MKRARAELLDLVPQLLKWLILATVIGALCGTASAAFLASLDWATDWRESHTWIIAFLPLAGFAVGWIYHRLGRRAEGGHNLILDEIHSPENKIPLRMTPLVFFGSVVTHLFGGSAGREGTAIQMGGSLADQLSRPLRLSQGDRRIVLMAGISGGFASVFGTPLAGTVFGLEVLALGRMRYEALFPCLIAAITGHLVTLAWGIHHNAYHVSLAPAISEAGILYACLAGAAFGTVGMLFAKATHAASSYFRNLVRYPPLRPLLGGSIVAVLVFASGTTKYIGLGIPTIQESFLVQLPPWDFAAKFAMTVITLGAGFKGGEVTPLFYIGATLGNALSHVLALPVPLLSGMGLVGVFAGAANTPLACTLLGIELFGADVSLYMAIACVVSYLFSGHAGIYPSQRIGASKHQNRGHEEGATLLSLHEPPPGGHAGEDKAGGVV